MTHRADLSILFSEEGKNTLAELTEANGDVEQYVKDIVHKSADLVNSWIAAGVESDAAKNVLASYKFEACELSKVGKVGITRGKKKGTKGFEIAIFAGADAATPAPAAAAATAEASAPKAKVASSSPSSSSSSASSSNSSSVSVETPSVKPVGRAAGPSAVSVEASRIIDLILPQLLSLPLNSSSSSDSTSTSSSSSESKAVTLETLRKVNALEAEVSAARISAQSSMGNKAIKAARARVEAAEAALAQNADTAAMKEVKAKLASLLIQELSMFQSEAYTSGMTSVKDKQLQLSFNPLR